MERISRRKLGPPAILPCHGGAGICGGTPLQVLLSAATIANNGIQMQPTIIHDMWIAPVNHPTFSPARALGYDPDLSSKTSLAKNGDCTATGKMKDGFLLCDQNVQAGMRLAGPDQMVRSPQLFLRNTQLHCRKDRYAEFCE